nr:MAG TPA: hypothetical protein [Bacteriophage sp.]
MADFCQKEIPALPSVRLIACRLVRLHYKVESATCS